MIAKKNKESEKDDFLKIMWVIFSFFKFIFLSRLFRRLTPKVKSLCTSNNDVPTIKKLNICNGIYGGNLSPLQNILFDFFPALSALYAFQLKNYIDRLVNSQLKEMLFYFPFT